MSLYGDYQSRLARAVLRGTRTEVIERVFGAEKDYQLDRVRQALLAGIPGKGPVDALPFIGKERQLPRAVGEADNTYAERLRTVWTSSAGWSRAGSHGGLLRALERAGLPMGTPDGCHILQRTKRYSYLNAGVVTYVNHSGFSWDAKPTTFWNQFAIVFGADVVALTSGSQLALSLNAIVRQWKPAKARFMGTWVVTTSPVWGWPVDTVWGQASLDWGESGVRYIAPG